MTARTLPVAVIAACVLAGTAVLGQQAPQPQAPVFRTNTELVEVDVVVVDKAGKRVHGLTQDDFIVRDRRQPQTIETFTEVRRDLERAAGAHVLPASVRRDVAANTVDDAARLVVVVLDDLHVWQGRSEVVKEIARKLVNELDPGSAMALLQTGGEHSTEVTTDRARLLESIEHFVGRRPVRRPLGPCSPSSARFDPETLITAGSGCDIQFVFSNRGLYRSLQDAAEILGRASARRKAFVLLSENLVNDPRWLRADGGSPLSGLSDSSGYAAGDPAGLSPVNPVNADDYAVLDMMNALWRGNVATYAIDPRGEVTSQKLMEECFPEPPERRDPLGRIVEDPCVTPFRSDSWVRVAQDGLGTITEATGGFAVTNTDNFATGASTILDDFDQYYLLGFYTADLTSKGFRAIDVQVRGRPDLTLRYRRGYIIHPDDEAKAARKNETRDPLHVLVDHPLATSGLPLRLHAIPLPHSGNRSKVAIALELTLPRSAMTSETELERLLDDIQYGVYAVDLNGVKVRQYLGSRARVALRPRPGLTSPPEHVTYQIAIEMELPAGRYQLRASAISAKLGQGGSVYLSVDIPDFSKSDLAMTDLLVGYADGLRVPVAHDRRDLTTMTLVRPTQFNRWIDTTSPRPVYEPTTTSTTLRSPLPFEPTLDRTFARSDSMRLFFTTAQRRRLPATATISALAADGTTVVTFSRDLSKAGDLDVRLPLGQLEPGAYRLRVVVADGRASDAKEIGFVVR